MVTINNTSSSTSLCQINLPSTSSSSSLSSSTSLESNVYRQSHLQTIDRQAVIKAQNNDLRVTYLLSYVRWHQNILRKQNHKRKLTFKRVISLRHEFVVWADVEDVDEHLRYYSHKYTEPFVYIHKTSKCQMHSVKSLLWSHDPYTQASFIIINFFIKILSNAACTK